MLSSNIFIRAYAPFGENDKSFVKVFLRLPVEQSNDMGGEMLWELISISKQDDSPMGFGRICRRIRKIKIERDENSSFLDSQE